MTECSFEGCNHPKNTIGLCRSHYRQHKQGKPLKPLGNQGGRNAKFKGEACVFEGCERDAKTNYKCETHDWQYRKYGVMWEIGKKRKEAVLVGNNENNNNAYSGKKFSTARYCPKCKTWMDWKKYYLEQGRCKQCWRKHLSELANDEEKKQPQSSMEELLAQIERNANKK